MWIDVGNKTNILVCGGCTKCGGDVLMKEIDYYGTFVGFDTPKRLSFNGMTFVSAILTHITDCSSGIGRYFVDKHEVNKHIFLGVRGAIEYDLKLLPKCPDRYRLYDHCITNGHITPSVMIFGSGDIFAIMNDNPSKKMSYEDLGKLHEDRKRLREEFMNRGSAYE